MANTNVTVSRAEEVRCALDAFTVEYDISALTAGLRANLTQIGPSGTSASEISSRQTAPCTDGSVVSLVYSGTDTTNNEIDIEYAVPAGGSLDGATFTVQAKWYEQARQDGQSISSDNNT